jgi:hypothetical protein
MSLYGRRKGVLDYDALYQSSLPPNATAAKRSPSGDPGDESQDWSPVRKAMPADYLLPASQRWMEHLPHDVCPRALATRFPRIANLVAMQWNDRGACPAYFEELLHHRRGCRHVFSSYVQRDIYILRSYCYVQKTTLGE